MTDTDTDDRVERVALAISLIRRGEGDYYSAHDEALARAAIAAADEWRPIETAPKDATLILAWNGRWMEIAMWERPNAIAPPSWRGAHCGVSHIDQPTHWMPLPQPPEAK